MTTTRADTLFPLPFVGRQAELDSLVAWLDAVSAGRGGTRFLAGAPGVGKTRLVSALADRASRDGWTVLLGRAYPVETGVPFALFADALAATVRGMSASALAVMTRGDGGMLANISPAFASGGTAPHTRDSGSGADAKARLLWSFSEFLGRLAAQQPLLIVLENLQWADVSSLELLHFVARQAATHRVALLCTYADTEIDANATLRTTKQSLVSLGAAEHTPIEPLDREALQSIVKQVFRADDASARTLAERLATWTQGNPFFAEEILKAMVVSGALHERGGAWYGWEADLPGLPNSIRDAVSARMDRLGAAARSVANFAAVIGTRVSHDALVAVTGLLETDVLSAIDELRAHSVLTESVEAGEVRYEFSHPLVRDVLYASLGVARTRLLHATVAESLETLFAADAVGQADVLAYHFARAESRGLAGKAVRYLAAAGRAALDRHANREAADYLSAALEQYDRLAEAGSERGDTAAECNAVVENLAQARQRLGEYRAATSLWLRARDFAGRAGNPAHLAAIERRLGLAAYWSGKYQEALAHFGVALGASVDAKEDSLQARIRVARSMTLHELGQPDEAKAEVDAALTIATALGDDAVLARVYRASLMLHIFIGPASRARDDGHRAIAFAEAAGARGVEWSLHWAMAMVGGLSGNGGEIAAHLAQSQRLAEELGSPVLRCWTAEVAIEFASASGEWDAALSLADRTIPVARALGLRVILPRLLVWAAMIHLHRGQHDRAKEMLDEAWAMLGDARRHRADVHSAVPVHSGLVAYHVAIDEHLKAIEIGEAGLALVDASGYVTWGIHRLLPMVIEAALKRGDIATAEKYRDRLRRDSEKLGHPLGIAWADTCDALILMMRREYETAIPLLRRAAEVLEAVPWVLDAARVRRKLAEVLAHTGDRDGATREVRRVHDDLVRLGAQGELSGTRELIRKLGLRPPARVATSGIAGLTGREVDVARLAALHKSNKEIAAALDISPRTVSTHLSNIFLKLDVASRGELSDVARREGLLR